jgi:import inner membrane translocase subunit TIM50
LSTALFRASLRDVTVRTTGRPSLRMLSTTKSIWDTSTSNTTKSDTRPPYQPVLKKKKKAKGVKEELTPMQIMTRVGIATSILTVIGAGYYLGRPYEKDETFKESSDGLKGYYERAYERIDRLVQYYRAPAYEKMLPDPLEDDLQPMTLVMNLDETLIYSTWDYQHGWRIAKRPGVDYFLAYISQFFELVLITSQPQMNAEPIIHKLDPVGYMPYRFYREATRYVDGKHVKDLNHLNRNLAHVIIMDSNPDAYMLQPDNAIAVPPWQGDPNDRFLIDIIPFLQSK